MANGLYGIYNSNRSADDHWGKNCFNSCFPTATACYMLNNDIPAIYIQLQKSTGQVTGCAFHHFNEKGIQLSKQTS